MAMALRWTLRASARRIGMVRPRQTPAAQRWLAAGRHDERRESPWTSDCWKCGRHVDRVNFFCGGCEVIQEPVEVKRGPKAADGAEVTHFALLGLPVSFDIDARALDKKFQQLQMKLHPDRYGNKTELEREYSAEHSSTLNEAYQTLRDPLERARYLLELRGIDALSEGGHVDMDPFVLMQVMEAREALDECEGDAALRDMETKVEGEMDALVSRVAAAFDADDMKDATRLTVELKYASKLLEEVKEKRARLY